MPEGGNDPLPGEGRGPAAERCRRRWAPRLRRGASPSAPASSPAAKARKDELIRLALGPDGSVAPDVRARAPGRGAWIGATAPRSMRPTAKGKLRGALAARVQDERRHTSPPISAPGSRRRCARRRSTASAWRRGPATSSPASDKIEAAARRGKVHLLLHAADAGADGQRASSTRPGGSAARRKRPQGMVFPEGRTILSMALGPRKCGTCRPDRSRCRCACPPRARPVAGFYWPRSRSGRWRARLEDRLG